MTKIDTYANTTAVYEGTDTNVDIRKVDPNEDFLQAVIALIHRRTPRKTAEFRIGDELNTALGWYLNKNLSPDIIQLLSRLDSHNLTAVVNAAHRFNSG